MIILNFRLKQLAVQERKRQERQYKKAESARVKAYYTEYYAAMSTEEFNKEWAALMALPDAAKYLDAARNVKSHLRIVR